MIQAQKAAELSGNFISIMQRIERDILAASVKGKTCIHYLFDRDENKPLINLFLEAEIDGSPNLAKTYLERFGYTVFSYMGVNVSWDKETFKAFDYSRKNGEPLDRLEFVEKL
jgi:hypothetical protein